MQATHEHNPEERPDLQKLRQAVMNCMPAILAANHQDPACPTDLPLADAIGLEGIYLSAQVGMLFLRGASVDDVEQHIANGGELPFEGAERGMFHAVLDELAERIGDRAFATREILKLAKNFDNMLTVLERDGRIPRDAILSICAEQFPNTRTSQA